MWWLESTQNPAPRSYFGKLLVKFFKKLVNKAGFLEKPENAFSTIWTPWVAVEKNDRNKICRSICKLFADISSFLRNQAV